MPNKVRVPGFFGQADRTADHLEFACQRQSLVASHLQQRNLTVLTRFKMKLEKTKPRQVTTHTQMDMVCNLSLLVDPLDQQTSRQSRESYPALIHEIASTPHPSSDLGRCARLKNLLPCNWFNWSIANSVGVSTSVQAQPPQALRKQLVYHEVLFAETLSDSRMICTKGRFKLHQTTGYEKWPTTMSSPVC